MDEIDADVVVVFSLPVLLLLLLLLLFLLLCVYVVVCATALSVRGVCAWAALAKAAIHARDHALAPASAIAAEQCAAPGPPCSLHPARALRCFRPRPIASDVSPA